MTNKEVYIISSGDGIDYQHTRSYTSIVYLTLEEAKRSISSNKELTEWEEIQPNRSWIFQRPESKYMFFRIDKSSLIEEISPVYEMIKRIEKNNPRFTEELEEGFRNMREGKVIPWEEIKKRREENKI